MGIRSFGRRLITGTKTTSNNPTNLWIGADAGNGFGAKKLLRSSIELDTNETIKGAKAAVLDGVQVLTRYCAIERPYWHAFLSHYSRLGVKYINVCVQTDADYHEVVNSASPAGMTLICHRIAKDIDPSSALKKFNLEQISDQESFTLLVDCDEYFQALRPSLALSDLFLTFPETGQFFLPWLMCPVLSFREDHRLGFWGHIGKPVARSSRMADIAFDHAFRVDSHQNDPRQYSLPAGMFGFSVVHYWSRSFRDCLLKTFNNRFKDSKSSDLELALKKIRSGDLPFRLRLLAYLRVQKGFLHIPFSPLPYFQLDIEEELLRECLSLDDEIMCRSTFDQYCNQLLKDIHHLPLYPCAALKTIVDKLPAPNIQ